MSGRTVNEDYRGRVVAFQHSQAIATLGSQMHPVRSGMREALSISAASHASDERAIHSTCYLKFRAHDLPVSQTWCSVTTKATTTTANWALQYIR